MASFVIMEPPAGDMAAGEAVFIRDGFSVLAFLVAPVWLLFNRLWIEAGLAVAATIALSAFASLESIGPAASILSLLLAIYFGLEANDLRVAALRRRGWREWGAVEADNLADAEVRYFNAAALEDSRPETPVPGAANLTPGTARGVSGPAVGLFAYPSAR